MVLGKTLTKMASGETPKAKSEKRERTITKKAMTTRKVSEGGVLKVKNTTPRSKRQAESKIIKDQKEELLDVISTPKSKENKLVTSNSVTKSGKKTWNRRPKPAHSGVPLPEKMKRLKELQLMIKNVDKTN